MLAIFSPLFAAEGSVPVAAEELFTIAGVPITNAMFTGVIVAIAVLVFFSLAAARSSVRPVSKFSYFVESIVEFVTGTVASNFAGDEKKARRFAALFIAFFTFILFNNLSGLLPGWGGSIYLNGADGVKEALLRPFTTDLNGTLALATVTMVTVQVFAIKNRGGWGYIKHFFSVTTPWYNPINFFIGPLEVISEITRLFTLALRLFGVIYAGEVLLHVIVGLTGNFAWIGAVPIVLMEIFFASIQTYLFIMLSSVYLQLGTAHDESHDEHSTVAPTNLAAGEAK